MRAFCFLLFIAFIPVLQARGQKVTIAEVRDDFYRSTLDYQFAYPLIEKLNNLKEPSPLLTAYKAATQAILAKPGWNIFKKMSYLRLSKDNFKDAIDRDKSDVEIRFLRLSIEHHLPKYLGYSKNQKEDKRVIMEKISGFSKKNLSDEVTNYILTFSIESGIYTAEEIELIKQMLM